MTLPEVKHFTVEKKTNKFSACMEWQALSLECICWFRKVLQSLHKLFSVHDLCSFATLSFTNRSKRCSGLLVIPRPKRVIRYIQALLLCWRNWLNFIALLEYRCVTSQIDCQYIKISLLISLWLNQLNIYLELLWGIHVFFTYSSMLMEMSYFRRMMAVELVHVWAL